MTAFRIFRPSTRRALAGIALTSIVAAGAISVPEAAFAANTAYYVSSTNASCSNAGAGTSSTAPWCNFTPVNSRTFQPGDRLLLERGSQWNQELTLSGNGTAASYITVDAYGAGALPKIIRSGFAGDVAVQLTNPNYWKLSHLEVGSAGVGILVKLTAKGNQGLIMTDLLVHDITGITSGVGYAAPGYNSTQDPAATAAAQADGIWMSSGINFAAAGVTYSSATEWLLKGITLDHIEGTHNTSSLHFETAYGTATTENLPLVNAFQNLSFNHLYFHDDNKASVGCRDGMAFTGVKNAIVMNSIFSNEASCFAPNGTAALYIAQSQQVKYYNNVVANTPNTGSPDQTGFDFEGFTDSVEVKGNYFGNNAGPGLEFLAIHGGGDFGRNHVVSGNTFAGNPVSLARIGTDYIYTGTIANNLTADSNFQSGGGTAYQGFTQSNNVRVSGPSHAAVGFSNAQGTNQWSYQRSTNGSDWSNLPYFEPAGKTWQPSASVTTPVVSQFEQHPGSGTNTVARVWTAAQAGTVSIRGTAFKSDTSGGDGVDIRITRNGSPIWPTSGAWQHLDAADRSGLATDLDRVTVAAGDVIRFETRSGATSNNDTLSWAPSVGRYQPMATFEAEDAQLSGTAVNTNNAGYTGTGFVDSFTAPGRSLTFQVTSTVAGASTVRIRYGNGTGTTRILSLYVNGVKQVVGFPDVRVNDWQKWGYVDVPVTLANGYNTLKLQWDPNDNGNINVDNLQVAATIDQEIREAEKFTLTGAAVSTTHAGAFTGTGYTDTWTSVGNAAQFTVTPSAGGSYPLNIRYANATSVDRSLSLYVNGVKQSTVVFPSGPYAQWNLWFSKSAPVQLNAGSNVISFRYDSTDNGNVNIDNVGVALLGGV